MACERFWTGRLTILRMIRGCLRRVASNNGVGVCVPPKSSLLPVEEEVDVQNVVERRLVRGVLGVTSLGSIRFQASTCPNPTERAAARLYEFRIPAGERLCELKANTMFLV